MQGKHLDIKVVVEMHLLIRNLEASLHTSTLSVQIILKALVSYIYPLCSKYHAPTL